jgi:hypothetical protein
MACTAESVSFKAALPCQLVLVDTTHQINPVCLLGLINDLTKVLLLLNTPVSLLGATNDMTKMLLLRLLLLLLARRCVLMGVP